MTRQLDQSHLDMAGLNLEDDTPLEFIPEEPPKPPAAIEKLIEEAKKALTAQEKGEKRSLSMVVVGAFIWARSWYILLMNSGPGHVDKIKGPDRERLVGLGEVGTGHDEMSSEHRAGGKTETWGERGPGH